MLHRGAVARPLLTHVLNKFAVPGFADIAPFGPIEHKLRYGIGNKLRVDTGALQNLTGIGAGLPAMMNRAGFFLTGIKRGAFQALLLFAGVVAGEYPLTFHVAEKAHVPVVAVGALFLSLQ